MSESVFPERRESPVLPGAEATAFDDTAASTESMADVQTPEVAERPDSEFNPELAPAYNAMHLSGMTAEELVASATEKATEAATAEVRTLYGRVRESGLAHMADAKTSAAEMITSAQQSAAVIERAVDEAQRY